jgi:hypothetical protein
MGTKQVDQMVSGVAATLDDTWTGDMTEGERREEEGEEGGAYKEAPAIFSTPLTFLPLEWRSHRAFVLTWCAPL